MFKCAIFCSFSVVCFAIPKIWAIEQDSPGMKNLAAEIKEKLVGALASNDNDHYLHKRQINSLHLQTPVQPQIFLDISSVTYNDHLNFLRQVTPDQEERFFLSGDRTTTVNPLSLFTNPTTEDPLERQKVAEQRRFQEEIANRAIREQQRRDLEQSTTSSTANPFLQSHLFSIDSDPILNFSPTSQLFLSPLSTVKHVPPPPQSYSNFQTLRITKERLKRSIDRQSTTGNELQNLIASTVNPVVDRLLKDTNPRHDLAKIGNWLIGNLAKQLERNIAHFGQTITRSTSPKPRFAKSKPYVSTELPSVLVPFPRPAVRESPASPASQATTTETPQGLIPFYSSTTRPVPANAFIAPDIPLHLVNVPFHSTSKSPPAAAVPLYSTPKPTQPASFSSSPDSPTSTLIPIVYSTTPQWSPETVRSYEAFANQFPGSWSPTKMIVYDGSSTASPTITTGLPTLTWTIGPQSSTTAFPKIRNIEILPTVHVDQNRSINAYENSIYQVYPQLYNTDHQTTRSTEGKTITTSSPIFDGTTSVSSLFKAKLSAFKGGEQQPKILQKGYPDTQQPNEIFDLLQHLNSSISQIEENASQGNPGTAIFIKVPEEETSTSGYIFDKAITSKHLSKKENSRAVKKNNRSAQLLRSTLVYRTPPGKRATVKVEESKNNQAADIGLFANLIESGKPISWILGTRKTTTSRPFVTALLNLIQKRLRR